jgi:hypothetical protein
VTVPSSKLVGLLFEAWKDMDRVLADLDPEEAVRPLDGGSSFAWTAAHVANQVDAWVNVRFQRRAPHELIGQTRFRVGGTGVADDWQAIQAGVQEVRNAARTYLEGLSESDLDLVIAYDGSLAHLRETGLPLRHALLRICAHHYFHIGEIATKRSTLGQRVGDYPGLLEGCI